MAEKLKLDLPLILPDVADGGMCIREYGWQADEMREMTFYPQGRMRRHPS